MQWVAGVARAALGHLRRQRAEELAHARGLLAVRAGDLVLQFLAQTLGRSIEVPAPTVCTPLHLPLDSESLMSTCGRHVGAQGVENKRLAKSV